eukprot:TRINITY_DN17955_c0_g1_i1.p1 TRINITY_DN17955_c0_g1~~TRINITY_DN17955_c0_g1_i1.p1  ORF type:complete len:691 (-),score=123.63 TRINITY_DN17955_c0_g1_i1:91-2136(-)
MDDAAAHRLLDAAKARQWSKVTDFLRSQPCLVNAQPAKRWSVLHQAAQAGAAEVVRRLLKFRADATAKTSSGQTALELAKEPTVQGLLTAHSKELAKRSELEHTFLDLAKSRRWELLRAMLRDTTDLAAVQPSGRWSALHHAASAGHAQAIQDLLASRADPGARTADGKTALELSSSAAATAALRAAVGTCSGGGGHAALEVLSSGDEAEPRDSKRPRTLADFFQAAGTKPSPASPSGASKRPRIEPTSTISCRKGHFELSDALSRPVLKGTYSFEPATCCLRSGTGELVGKFTADEIAEKPFPSSMIKSAFAESPLACHCVTITNSEIMEEIQKPGNAGAFFVLPSQLNGAEYPAHVMIVDKINKYKHDKTGGPRGQLAVHPAAGQFLLDNAACDHRPAGINAADVCLANVREKLKGIGDCGIRVKNGYLAVPICSTAFKESFLEHLRAELHRMRCLCMDDVLTCGLAPTLTALSTATHRISLVYASAIPVQAYLNEKNPDREFQQEISRLVILSQYYGALRLAALKRPTQRNRIFLMPLGGGVFNNSAVVIVGALASALELLAAEGIDVRERLDVRLLTFRGSAKEQHRMAGLLRELAGSSTCSATPVARSPQGPAEDRRADPALLAATGRGSAEARTPTLGGPTVVDRSPHGPAVDRRADSEDSAETIPGIPDLKDVS